MHGHPRNGVSLVFIISFKYVGRSHLILKTILKVLPVYCNHLFLLCVQNWCHGSHLKLHIGSCSGVGRVDGEQGRVHDQVQP